MRSNEFLILPCDSRYWSVVVYSCTFRLSNGYYVLIVMNRRARPATVLEQTNTEQANT